MDRATQHYRSRKVRTYLEENKDLIRVTYFPKGSPEFNAVEECWKQGKYELLVSKYYHRFHDLKMAIREYYRTKRFNLDIFKYLLRWVHEFMLISIASSFWIIYVRIMQPFGKIWMSELSHFNVQDTANKPKALMMPRENGVIVAKGYVTMTTSSGGSNCLNKGSFKWCHKVAHLSFHSPISINDN